MRGTLAGLVVASMVAGCGGLGNYQPSSSSSSSTPTTSTPVAIERTSAPPPPAPSPTVTIDQDDLKDAQYIALLMQRGVEIDDRDKLILDASTVCVYLSQPGTSLIDAATGLMDEYGYPGKKASAIATSAVDARCPEYK